MNLSGRAPPVDSLLLTTAALQTWADDLQLTNATGFFFERDGNLYLVTSRHVVCDEVSGHFPDRLDVELHTDPSNLAQAATMTLPLSGADGSALWRQGTDDAGLVEALGEPVHIVEGDPLNVKITHPDDVPFAEAVLSMREGKSGALGSKRKFPTWAQMDDE